MTAVSSAIYVVATPSGIRKLMDDERWSFFYATKIFIVRRYDLETIRKAVYGRIKEIHDDVPLDAEEPGCEVRLETVTLQSAR